MVRGPLHFYISPFAWLHRSVVLTLLAIGINQPATADLLPSVDFYSPSIEYSTDIPWSLGFEFEVWEDVDVVSLGFYDAGIDGFQEDHAVGLYDNFGTLLAQALLTNDSLLNGLFRWESIAPTHLYAGETYVVSGYLFLDPYTWNPYDAVMDSRIYIPAGRYSDADHLIFPEQRISELLGFFGPNLLLANPDVVVPEPDGMLLLLVGIFLLLHFRQRVMPLDKHTRCGKPLVLATLGIGLAASVSVSALELTTTPVQGDNTWAGQVPLASRYQRYQHANVGVIAQYDNVFDAEGNYIVPVGEVLRWVFVRDDSTLAYLEYRYIGGPEHCWVTSSGVQNCGTFNKFLSFLPLKCRPEQGDYQLLFFRTGVEALNHHFDTERFKMKRSESGLVVPTSFLPKAYGSDGDGGSKEIRVAVVDDLNCNQKLEDVQITVQSTLVPGTNSHQHFSSARYGTGEFQPIPEFPVTLTEHDTKVVGKTRATGDFRVRYQALDYALTEQVRFELLRPAVNGFAEDKYETTRNWNIKWPFVGEFPSFNFGSHTWDYTANGQACHGANDTQATALVAYVGDALALGLDGYFQFAGGYFLSLNDASFPWGGIVDSWGAMDSGTGACGNSHVSHRIGIDIDINRRDKAPNGGRVIMNLDGTAGDNYGGVALLSTLDDQMELAGFNRVPEDASIHYRYNL